MELLLFAYARSILVPALTPPTCAGNEPQRLATVMRALGNDGASVNDSPDALAMARNSDGRLIARPLSPHLQVYRWPISMALSISHRITGLGLGIGTLLLTWWLVAAASSDAAFAAVQWFLSSWLGVIALLGWSAALIFHLVTGIRHLVWDAGWGFDDRVYRSTGWGAVAVTVVAVLIVWIIGLVVW
jgi:succinate dehydrogenase / fumarate reductase, cytochrome b subunit